MTITDTPTPTDGGTLVLSISDAALGTVLGIRDQEDDAEALGLRVEITGSKGAEFTYDLGFEELTSADADTLVEQVAGGLKVMIPAATVENLRGSVLDLSRAGAQGGRRFLVKQGHSSAICELDLAGLEDFVTVLSGTTDNIALLDEIRVRHGNDASRWLPVLLKQVQDRRSRTASAVPATKGSSV